MTYAEYINKLNQIIEDLARENKHSRSYVRVIRPHNETKINIIGSFEEAIQAEEGKHMTFDKGSRKSFGMIPSETFEKYKHMIFGDDSVFASEAAFQKYVDENYENFCVDIDDFKEYYRYAKEKNWFSEKMSSEAASDIEQYCCAFQKALYARCVLQTVRVGNFQIFFRTGRKEYEDAKQIILQDKACESNSNTGFPYLTVSGRMQENTLQELSKFICFKKQESVPQDAILEVYPKGAIEGISFTELYQKDYAVYYQFRGSAIYSGVIPRLCRVDYIEPKMSNMNMQSLHLILGRTSYLTMYAMNKPKILEHPFLGTKIAEGPLKDTLSWKEINHLFDEIEMNLQREFWKESDAAKDEDFNRLNNYLKHSWNIHNVNISGNLITSDNYCIYTQRSNKVVDRGNYYCSVNGGSEIFDSAVEFYLSSVVEDLPTIKYTCDPVYFGGELTREAIGELGIIDSSTFWNYYGISVMGDSGAKDNLSKKQAIWFHFNVLGERQCLDTFDQIVENKKMAAENFESSRIFGYRLLAFEKFHQIVAMRLTTFVQLIMDNTDVLTLIGLFAGMMIGQEQLNISTGITIFFGILGFFSILYKGYEMWKNAKYKKTVISYQNRNRILFEKLLRKKKLGEARKKDPIYMTLIALRFERVFH